MPNKKFINRIILFLLLTALSLSFFGCKNKKPSGETPSDSNQPVNDFYSDRNGSIIKNKGLYYFVPQTYYKSIKYYNPETQQSSYLCSRPDCGHKGNLDEGYLSENSCTAFLGTAFNEVATQAITTDGTWLYANGSDGSNAFIFRISLDGAVKEKIADLGKVYIDENDNFSLELNSFVYYSGYIYFSMRIPKYDLETIDTDSPSLGGFSHEVIDYRVKTEPGSQLEAFYKKESKQDFLNILTSSFRPHKNKMYRFFSESGETYSCSISLLDTETLEYTNVLSLSYASNMFLHDDKIWFVEFESDSLYSKKTLYTYSLETQEKKKIIELEGSLDDSRIILSDMFFADNYFAVSYSGSSKDGYLFDFYVKEDEEYKLVKSMVPPQGQLVGIDGKYMFFSINGAGYSTCTIEDFLKFEDDEYLDELLNAVS